MKKSDKILVGKEEICEVAGIGPRLFSELVARSQFPARFFGGKWRAHKENIEDWHRIYTRSPGPQPDIADLEDENEEPFKQNNI